MQGFMAGVDDAELHIPSAVATDAFMSELQTRADTASDIVSALATGGVLVSTAARSEPFSSIDRNWLLLVHPSVFPQGTGRRPDKMSLQAYLHLLVRRYPREQHAQNVSFLMDAFNLLQRQNVAIQSHIQLSMTPHLLRHIATITPELQQATLQILRSGLRGAALKQRLSNTPYAVQCLFKAFKSSSARVLGAPQQFTALRGQAYAMWHGAGTWTAAINMNPSDLTSPLVMKLAGHAIHTSPLQRWTVVAGNPVACAQFFQLFIKAFNEVVLCWSTAKGKQDLSSRKCIFGVIVAIFWKYENTQRGALHGHNTISQPHLSPRRLQATLRNPSTRSYLLSFMDAMVQQFLPAPFYSDKFRLQPAPPGMQMLAAHDDPNRPFGTDLQPLPNAATVSAMTEEERGELRKQTDAVVAHAIIDKQIHNHSFTCCKRGGAATDTHCRMLYSRPTEAATTYDETTGCINLRRQDGYIVPSLYAVQLACPCNMAVYPFCEQSRYKKRKLQWDTDTAAGKTKRHAPEVPNLLDSAADACDYALKYVCKDDMKGANEALLNSVQVTLLINKC